MKNLAATLSPDRIFKLCTPGAERTNPELAELLSAYGQAMWAWTRAESALFLVFAHIVEPATNKHSKALRAAFFSVISPQARLDMINAVVAATWGKERINDWRPIYLECKKQVTLRGKIAHLVGHSYERNGKPHAVPMEPIWHPNTKRTHGEANAIPYTTKYLNELARNWGELNGRLLLLVSLVSAQNESKPDTQTVEILRAALAAPSLDSATKSASP